MRSKLIAIIAWQKVLTNLRKRKQMKMFEADLTEAFNQVAELQKSKARKKY